MKARANKFHAAMKKNVASGKSSGKSITLAHQGKSSKTTKSSKSCR